MTPKIYLIGLLGSANLPPRTGGRVVTLANKGSGNLPGPEAWLIIRRNVLDPAVIKYYFSNAPVTTPVIEFVRISGMRWPIETLFKESKGEVGLDHYELRSWLGWHHHGITMASPYAVGLSGSSLPGPFDAPFSRTSSGFDHLSGSHSACQRIAQTSFCHSGRHTPGAVLPEAELCCVCLSLQVKIGSTCYPSSQLCIVILIPVIYGVFLLRTVGRPMDQLEATTHLVTRGIYHFIRHPLYASLIYLAWGLFFKSPSVLDGCLAVVSAVFLYATVHADESECLVKFGGEYAAYMKKTKRFIPLVF